MFEAIRIVLQIRRHFAPKHEFLDKCVTCGSKKIYNIACYVQTSENSSLPTTAYALCKKCTKKYTMKDNIGPVEEALRHKVFGCN